MQGLVRRYFSIALLVAGASIVGALSTNSTPVRALGGTGYFTGLSTCTTSYSGRACSDTTPPYANDVVLGRPGTWPAVPYFGTNKIAYADWVVGEWNAGGTRREAARFIIATMLNDRAAADNVTEFRQRFDNPNLTMSYIGSADPNLYGSISFRGKTSGYVTDFFWTSSYTGSVGPLYIFYDSGNRVYVLEQNCGNPVGLPAVGIPPYNPENWSLSAWSGIRGPSMGSYQATTLTNGKVGDSFYWSNWLKNNGPTNMQKGVTFLTDRQVIDASGNVIVTNFSNDLGLWRNPHGTNRTANAGQYIYNQNGDGAYATQDTLKYTIQPQDGGRKYCQRIAATPANSWSSDWVRSNWACVYVPLNYTITPTISVSPDYTMVESPATSYTVNSNVTSSGTWSAPNTQWYTVRIRYDPGKSDPVTGAFTGNSTSNQAPCDYFRNSSNLYSDCNASWQSGSGQVPGAPGISWQGGDSFSDFKVGERICYATAVTKPTQNTNPTWGYSNLKCIVAAKRPRVQVWGGDVRVGSNYFAPLVAMGANDDKSSILTGRSIYGTGIKGSWGEYGLFAPTNGTIDSASGGALSGSVGAANSTPGTMLNKLTFSNTDATQYGHYAPPASVATLVGDLMSRPATKTVTGSSLDISTITTGSAASPKTAVVDINSNLLYVSGTLSPNLTTLILRSTNSSTAKTLYIGPGPGPAGGASGNLLIGNRPFRSASEVPQIIVIANDIIIKSQVTQIDAWLIAKPEMASAGGGTSVLQGGKITTCDDFSEPYYQSLHAGSACDQNHLQINGPVIARELQLRRTNGEDPNGNNRASSEVINSRPDSYLWATGQSTNTGRIDTVMTTELPPRF